MPSATTSGFRIALHDTARVTATGVTSSGAAGQLFGTRFFAEAGGSIDVSATTSDANVALVTPISLGPAAVLPGQFRISAGAPPRYPAVSLDVPVQFMLEADTILVAHQTSGSGSWVPLNDPSTGTATINVALNTPVLLRMVGVGHFELGATGNAELTNVVVSSTASVFSLAATSSGSMIWTVTPVSTGTGDIVVTAAPLWDSTTSGVVLRFPASTSGTVTISVFGAVADVIVASYVVE